MVAYACVIKIEKDEIMFLIFPDRGVCIHRKERGRSVANDANDKHPISFGIRNDFAVISINIGLGDIGFIAQISASYVVIMIIGWKVVALELKSSYSYPEASK